MPRQTRRTTRPQDVGLDATRLDALMARLRADVGRGEIPGAVVLVGRNDKIAFCEAVGFRDREAGAAMKTDAIFRIASMTKPIVSLAAMMLVEEDRLTLADPVSKYLPAMAGVKVGVERTTAGGKRVLDLVEPARAMTVHDLLRHTSGLGYGWISPSLAKKAYIKVEIHGGALTTAGFVERLAGLPLHWQPGTTWEYSVSTDVLGAVIEAIAGQTLDAFLAERILAPLGMTDTGFHVPASKHDRIAEPQAAANGARPAMRDVRNPPARCGGGGGMVSTAADYARFCQFLLNGGELDGKRLVSRKTIELMTADHLPPDCPVGPDMEPEIGPMTPLPRHGQGFGLGFALRTAAGRNSLPGSVGDYHWSGAFGTVFWVDPVERLYAILMTQTVQRVVRHVTIMRQGVYAAIAD